MCVCDVICVCVVVCVWWWVAWGASDPHLEGQRVLGGLAVEPKVLVVLVDVQLDAIHPPRSMDEQKRHAEPAGTGTHVLTTRQGHTRRRAAPTP